jgi:molybdopterin-containing oxidoreductase family iron-sulfur binding subunit
MKSSGRVETRLDLAALREKLASARGPRYWRSLEEAAETPEFQELLEREFPEPLSQIKDAVGRRKFLRLMGASLALAGFSGCTRQPEEKILPFARSPEEAIPGKPRYFATALHVAGNVQGVLVESHMGRPTKIEGNPLHPASLGATDALAQASVLTLYDPDRSQVVIHAGEISRWSSFLADLGRQVESQKLSGGRGLRLLTGDVLSPTLARQIERVLETFPEARWFQYEPAGRSAVSEGARLAFGQDLGSYYRFDQAEAIVSFDADFLTQGPGSVRYARDFRIDEPALCGRADALEHGCGRRPPAAAARAGGRSARTPPGEPVGNRRRGARGCIAAGGRVGGCRGAGSEGAPGSLPCDRR